MLKMSGQEGRGELELPVSLEILTWSGRFNKGGGVDVGQQDRAGPGSWQSWWQRRWVVCNIHQNIITSDFTGATPLSSVYLSLSL